MTGNQNRRFDEGNNPTANIDSSGAKILGPQMNADAR